VHVAGGITWEDAQAAAEAQGGYLATLTSAEENDWLTLTFAGNTIEGFRAYLDQCWLGGYQLPGSVEPDGGWAWVTGEEWAFTNWWPTEPNNNPEGENAILLDHGLIPGTGAAWNDLTSTWPRRGYVLEFSTDSDEDGIPDDQDACPDEDASGFDADGDGCIDSISGLLGMVESMLNEGLIEEQLRASILAKLTNAAKSAEQGNINAAINQLAALMHDTEAHRAKKISEESADQLIAYIESVIDWHLTQFLEG